MIVFFFCLFCLLIKHFLIDFSYTLPCRVVSEVGLEASISYTPLCAHSFLKFRRMGVPESGLFFLVWIFRPTLN